MINFLNETLEAIDLAGESINNIVYIGTSEDSCTWEEFKAISDREYDNGLGREYIACDLTIVFKDGCRLVREEYDGSESWIIEEPYTIPESTGKLTTVF